MNADWLADSAEEVEYVALREAAAARRRHLQRIRTRFAIDHDAR
jgi:hypothetical protein